MKYHHSKYKIVCMCLWGLCKHRKSSELRALKALFMAFYSKVLCEVQDRLLRKKRLGWDDRTTDLEDLKREAIRHIEKGDPIGAAAYLGFWWNRIDETRTRTDED